MATPIPFGTEFLVNTSTLNHQDSPSVAALANGKFVVVWEYDRSAVGQGDDVMMTIFNADGTKFGTDTVVNQSGANTHQQAPVVAALTDGRFVVAWEDHQPSTSMFGDQSGSSIKMRIFNNDGTPAADELRVNTTTENDQTEPAIAALTGGGFVISWTTEGPVGLDIRARAYGANGSALGNDFAVGNSGSDDVQSTVAGLANSNNYVIAWSNSGPSATIRAEIFTGNGVTPPDIASGGFTVTTSLGSTDPSIAGLSSGGFVVTWTAPVSASDHDIRGRFFQADGTPFLGEGPLAASLSNETQSSVAATLDGSFFVAWTDANAELGDISGSHIGAAGGATFEEFAANLSHVNGNQSQPSVATLSDGRIIVVWTDPGQTPGVPDVGSNSVRGRIFDPRTAAVNLIGTNLGDDWVGTGLDDVMDGAFGNDRIDGAGGNDSLFGGLGDDTLIGGLGADLMYGGAGNDTYFADDPGDQAIELENAGVDQVFSSVSFALGANIEILVLTGAAANGTGNALANTILGNALANILDGGAGADLMLGGAGNDTYVVDDPGDVVDEAAAGSNGVDTVLAAASFTLGVGVENLTLIGSVAINGAGNELANTLIGNAAANILTGGLGADQFVFGGALDKKTNVDTLLDFSPADDTIVLDNAIFAKLKKEGALKKKYFEVGKKADDGNDFLVYNKKTGVLAYDKDGEGGKKAIAFAILDGSPDDVSHKDFLIVA